MYYKNVIGFPPAPAQMIHFDRIERQTMRDFRRHGYTFIINENEIFPPLDEQGDFYLWQRNDLCKAWARGVIKLLEDRTVTK